MKLVSIIVLGMLVGGTHINTPSDNSPYGGNTKDSLVVLQQQAQPAVLQGSSAQLQPSASL